jgi:hypothetical protein
MKSRTSLRFSWASGPDGIMYCTVLVLSQPFYGDNPEWNTMLSWCVENFGPTYDVEPAQRWYVNNARFWFREQQDFEWFALKWS